MDEFDQETRETLTRTTRLKMRIYRYDFNSYCVEFSLLNGNYDDFILAIDEIEPLLKPFNVWIPIEEVME